MKIVMINDCAFVGETLLKYMPSNIEKQHLKRTRGLWDKTVNLAYRILRAKGDVFHVHYLLQDCYVSSRFGKKPLIGHAHGSDLRQGMKHPIWRRIVKHNLNYCNKILVSTPDILYIAKKFRADAQYLPNPVDLDLFNYKPQSAKSERKKILIASSANWALKGTDITLRALHKIKDEADVSIVKNGRDFDKTVALASSLGLRMKILPWVPHDRINQYMWDADVVIDQFKAGSLGMISLEAIACGRPVITYVSSEFREYEDFPLKDVRTEQGIVTALKRDHELWQKEYEYLNNKHDPTKTSETILEIYEAVTH